MNFRPGPPWCTHGSFVCILGRGGGGNSLDHSTDAALLFMRLTPSIWTRRSRAGSSSIVAFLLALQVSLFAGVQFWRAPDLHGRGSAANASSVTSCGNESADDSGVEGRGDQSPDKRSDCCDFGPLCAMGRISIVIYSLGDHLIDLRDYFYFVYDEKHIIDHASLIWIGSSSPRGPPAYS